MNGTFRAFLSSSDQNLDSLVYYPIDRNVPIVNSKVCIDPFICLLRRYKNDAETFCSDQKLLG